MNTEQWKPVVGYEGVYSVSNLGRVRREKAAPHTRPGRIRNPTSNHGYPSVSLWNEGKSVLAYIHRLVAEAFLGQRPHGMQINHIDGDKCNNVVTNLEYVTAKRNTNHAIETGLRTTGAGETNHNNRLSKLSVIEIRAICRIIPKRVINKRRIGRAYGVTAGYVTSLATYKTWKHIA